MESVRIRIKGLDEYSSFALDIKDSDAVDIQTLQDQLGHSNIRTTQIDTHGETRSLGVKSPQAILFLGNKPSNLFFKLIKAQAKFFQKLC